jgi:hypothetical protein
MYIYFLIVNILCLGYNEVMILANENEDVANKWACVIDYFITK